MPHPRSNQEANGTLLRLIHLTVGFLALLMSACASPEKTSKAPLRDRVAILPFDNHSLDLEAGDKVRRVLREELLKRRYRIVSLKKIERKLRALGFTDGGQLRALPFSKLQKTIKADFYCYGEVLDYRLKSAVLASERRVVLRLRFVEYSSGKTVYDHIEESTRTLKGYEGVGDLALYMTGKAVTGVTKGIKSLLPKGSKGESEVSPFIADVDLSQEIWEVVHRHLNRFSKAQRKRAWQRKQQGKGG